MISPIRISVDGQKFHIDNTKVFSGGELHVNLNHLPDIAINIGIKCWLDSSDAIMQLLLVSDALRRKYKQRPVITVGYMPYARQDRMCAAGDAFSMRVMADVMAVVNPAKLFVIDIHSEAALDELQDSLHDIPVTNITQVDIIRHNKAISDLVYDRDVVLVSPDKGAVEKTLALANNYYKADKVVNGVKQRNPVNGSLTGFSVETNGVDIVDKHCLIVDDICDGGGTFLGLAAELKKLGAGSISLYVTHGIFSKGLEVFDNIIGNVYSTDTVRSARELKSTQYTQFHLIHV